MILDKGIDSPANKLSYQSNHRLFRYDDLVSYICLLKILLLQIAIHIIVFVWPMFKLNL
jgi:hypothetical protein